MVQEPVKAEGVTLDLIHFLAQILVEKNNPNKQTPPKNHRKNPKQTIKNNNKRTCEQLQFGGIKLKCTLYYKRKPHFGLF